MDHDSIEGFNEVRPAVYRAALKLRSLQKICHLNVVTLRELLPALHSTDDASNQGGELSREEVMQSIDRMFHNMPGDGLGQVMTEASGHICSLLFQLYDRDQSDLVSCISVEVALIALSGDTLSVKYQALVGLAEKYSCRERGTVSRSGLQALLQDLSQVPMAVQEDSVFGSVEAAVRSCFSGVLTAWVSEDHVVSWLRTEPCLLLWLSTLYRLSVSESVTHAVRCHACKAYPITGLRYRCMKCVNLHLCQTCFLTERPSKKHKNSHPVLEHCTQPSWKESLTSLASSARHALLPRRYKRRKAERRKGLMRVSCQESQTSDLPSDSSSLAHNADSSANQKNPAIKESPHGAPPLSLTPPLAPDPSQSPAASVHSKTLQTEQSSPLPQNRASVLLKDVRDLQRDKWLLEQELQVWRTAVQTEQGTLEDRCCEMEASMETLRQHNVRLQDMLTQALVKTETHQAADVAPQGTAGSERDTVSVVESFSSGWTGNEEGQEVEENVKVEDKEDCGEDECEEEESERELEQDEDKNEDRREEERIEDDYSDDVDDDDDDEGGRAEPQSNTETYSSPVHWDMHFEEQEQMEDSPLSGAIEEMYGVEEVDSGTSSFEELEQQLCELVQRLKRALSEQALTDTGCELEKGLLVDAAEEVGNSLHRLVSTPSPQSRYQCSADKTTR